MDLEQFEGCVGRITKANDVVTITDKMVGRVDRLDG